MQGGMTISSFVPSIFCAKTAPKHPVLEAASTHKYLGAFSLIRLQNNGSLTSLFFMFSKASKCFGSSTYFMFLLLLVKGDRICICFITSKVITLLMLFTKPKKLLISFLVSGGLAFLIFSIRLGSGIMKSLQISQPRNKILVLANSLLPTDIFTLCKCNRSRIFSNSWK